MVLPTAKRMRAAVTKVAGAVFVFFVAGLATHFYDGYLTKHGEQLNAALSNVVAIVVSTPAQWVVAMTVGTALGFWLDSFLRRKENEPLLAQARIDLTGLADEAEAVANGIYNLLGENPDRWVTHQNYKGDDEAHERGRAERDERVYREYHRDYATRAWKVLETASKYVEVSKSEIWHVQHIGMGVISDLPDMARLLATVAARLREIDVPHAFTPKEAQQSLPASKRGLTLPQP